MGTQRLGFSHFNLREAYYTRSSRFFLHKGCSYTKVFPTQRVFLHKGFSYTKVFPTQRFSLHKGFSWLRKCTYAYIGGLTRAYDHFGPLSPTLPHSGGFNRLASRS
jgi:hypothetical protein